LFESLIAPSSELVALKATDAVNWPGVQTATVDLPVVLDASDDVVVDDVLGDEEQAAQQMRMARDVATRT